MELAAGISAASSALEIAKAMRQIGKDYDAVVIKGQVVDLMDKLLDVKTALQDAKAETEAKDHEIEQLKQAAQVRVETVERHGMRFRASQVREGEPQGLPFCSRCDQVDGRMITTADNGRGVKCPQCKATFEHARFYLWDND
ncbi:MULTISPECIES: hypothetical protein [Bacteria]|uniref:hypothetical protein n=1 Tax=Bacteria TaxID=2 RepID=UPI00070EBAD9|nr:MULTISPECIES: hypothetical protein [Bacteria]TCJ39699.1 hypothetical protein E0504_06970 [Parafrankia sp. BMG5.11]